MTLGGFNGEADLHVMFNMYSGPLDFEVPALPDRRWFKAIDSAQPAPHEIAEPGSEPEFSGSLCSVAGHSIVVLISRSHNDAVIGGGVTCQ